MKKLYTFALAAFVAATASAAVAPLGLKKTNPFAQKMQAAEQVALKGANAKAQAPKKYAESDWEVMGTGKFVEGFISSTVGVDIQTLSVTVQKHKTTEGLYRVVKPYATYQSPSVNITYVDSVATDMIIHAEDPTAVYFEDFCTGISYYGTAYKNFVVNMQASSVIAGSGFESTKTKYPALFGTLKDGIFSIPNAKFTAGANEYSTVLLKATTPTGEKLFATNKDCAFSLTLPGGKDYDLSVSIDKQCSSDNQYKLSITAGKDVSKVKIVYLKGDYDSSADNLNAVAAQGQSVMVIDGKKELALDLSSETELSRYTLFVVVANADGTAAVNGKAIKFYTADKTTTWQALPAKGKYTDAVFAFEMNNDKAAATYECNVEQSTAVAGLYRFESPLGSSDFSYSYINEHVGDCKHYIYINVADPNKCYILDSPVGLDLGYGPIAIYSIPAMGKDAEMDESQYSSLYGTMDASGKVTFPLKSVLESSLNYDNGGWYYCDTATRPTVFVIPSTSGVSDIVADQEAAPEYFTLQGVRIQQPAAGTMVIERRGGKVQKTVVR